MTVWRIPAAKDDGDPYTYVDLGWADSLTPGAEEGAWVPAETFTHLMLIAAAGAEWVDADDQDAANGELANRLEAYAASNRMMIFGADRYIVQAAPKSEGDWWDVIDTHDPDRRAYARRRLRQAADDEALKLNGKAS